MLVYPNMLRDDEVYPEMLDIVDDDSDDSDDSDAEAYDSDTTYIDFFQEHPAHDVATDSKNDEVDPEIQVKKLIIIHYYRFLSLKNIFLFPEFVSGVLFEFGPEYLQQRGRS